MSNETAPAQQAGGNAACPNCGTPTKKTSFRTGSLDQPKRDEHHCSSCGQHQPAEQPVTLPSVPNPPDNQDS